MSSQPFWTQVIQWTIFGLVMGALGKWLGNARMAARPGSDSRVLSHPRTTLVIGVVCTAVGLAFVVLPAILVREGTVAGGVVLVFAPILFGSAMMIREYYIVRVEVSETGMTWRKLSGARKALAWKDVKSVRYSNALKWFRVEAANGDVARLSAMLMGLPQFAQMAWDHAPAQAFDEFTMQTIQQTARGNPPSVFG